MGIKEAIEKSTKHKKGKPLSSFELDYDAPQNQLEPTYYWILDFVSDLGFDLKKVTDNFTSSPGSGHFQEMGARATRMQEEGMKILGGVNQVVKSILNLIYDLKEFEIRLKHYEDSRADDKNKKEGGMLALKNVWLDNVDLKRGRGSIHQMAAELGYTTLREAFLAANSIEDVNKMASKEGIINDQVKRILIPRIDEFLKWREYSEKELKKRFNIEKSYLKSQVETLKLYTSWVRPYLKAAQDLKQQGFETNPSLVNAFSTSVFELVLFGKKKAKAPSEVSSYNFKRDYYSCMVVSFGYRGHISQKVTQRGDYAFGGNGKLKMEFDSYALNEDELKLLEKELEKESIDDGLSIASDVAQTSLDELKEDVEHFLENDDPKKKEEEQKRKDEDLNPFVALISIFKLFKSSDDKKEKGDIKDLKEIKKDNYYEQMLRQEAEKGAKGFLHTTYDIYKKAHGMASAPDDFDN